jgi:hypothetical protein
VALRVLELWRAEPDFMLGEARPEPAASALLTGETGPLLVACLLGCGGSLADDLLARVRANVANEAEDLMWGTPGTLLAAAAMREATGEERWDAAARESAGALASRRDGEGLWTQHLCGEEFQGLGAPHGLVGDVRALLSVDDPRNEALRRETAALLAACTGDERWLERARRFAVHALGQADRLAVNGRRRYSLWTGDLGTACFAAACLDADARYPIVERFV